MNETVPQVICSDDTAHTKIQIAIYLFKILAKLPSKTEILKIWSDGPNNQFKNKYIAALIKPFEEIFKIKIYWNFFATSHGKGCVDGIGAVVKNRVRRLMNSRQKIVNGSSDFVDGFNSENSVIGVMNMTECEAEKIRSDLKLDDIFNSAKAVPKIFSYHQLQVINDKIVGNATSVEGYGCP